MASNPWTQVSSSWSLSESLFAKLVLQKDRYTMYWKAKKFLFKSIASWSPSSALSFHWIHWIRYLMSWMVTERKPHQISSLLQLHKYVTWCQSEDWCGAFSDSPCLIQPKMISNLWHTMLLGLYTKFTLPFFLAISRSRLPSRFSQ